MRIKLFINEYKTWISSAAELRQELGHFASEQFLDIWLSPDSAPSLMALVNLDIGWLMYVRGDGDAGLRSYNPGFKGDTAQTRKYRLSNGQVDELPESWALPVSVLTRALEHFIDHRQPAPFVNWYDEHAALRGPSR